MKKIEINFSLSKVYGVVINGRPGTIIRQSLDSGHFIVRPLDDISDTLTSGNCWPHYSQFRSLDGCITKLLSDGREVFEFDTIKELMTWVINFK